MSRRRGFFRKVTLRDNYGVFAVLYLHRKPGNKFWQYARDWSCGLPGIKHECRLVLMWEPIDDRDIMIITRDVTEESALPDHFAAEQYDAYTLPRGAEVVWTRYEQPRLSRRAHDCKAR